MINGMENAEAFGKLTRELQSKSKEGSGSAYVSIDAIRERVASVLAPWNYNYEVVGAPQVIEVRDNVSVIVTGRITIIDDDGKVIAVRQTMGGYDVPFMREDKNRVAQEIKTMVASACTEAYKKCWQEFGVGSTEVQYKPSAKAKGSTWYDVTFLSDFSVGNNMLTAQVRMPDGSERQLTIMQRGIAWMVDNAVPGTKPGDIISMVAKSYGANKDRKTMRVYGSLSTFRGKDQLLYEAGSPKNNNKGGRTEYAAM